MTYQIFEMIPNSRLETDGWYTKTVVSYTLEQCEYPDRYSLSEAEAYIKQNTDKFKYKKITILPVLEIDYNGDIR